MWLKWLSCSKSISDGIGMSLTDLLRLLLTGPGCLAFEFPKLAAVWHAILGFQTSTLKESEVGVLLYSLKAQTHWLTDAIQMQTIHPSISTEYHVLEIRVWPIL